MGGAEHSALLKITTWNCKHSRKDPSSLHMPVTCKALSVVWSAILAIEAKIIYMHQVCDPGCTITGSAPFTPPAIAWSISICNEDGNSLNMFLELPKA